MKGMVAEFLIENENKTGIDLDDVSEFEFIKSYFNAKYMFPENEINVYISSSGKGYHIEIVGVKSRLSARRILGDCRDRIDYSILRSSSICGYEEISTGDPVVDDVLFTFKTKVVDDGKKRKVYRRRRIKIDHKTVISSGFWYSPKMGIIHR